MSSTKVVLWPYHAIIYVKFMGRMQSTTNVGGFGNSRNETGAMKLSQDVDALPSWKKKLLINPSETELTETVDVHRATVERRMKALGFIKKGSLCIDQAIRCSTSKLMLEVPRLFK